MGTATRSRMQGGVRSRLQCWREGRHQWERQTNDAGKTGQVCLRCGKVEEAPATSGAAPAADDLGQTDVIGVAPAAAHVAGGAVDTASSPIGTILTAGDGRALYEFQADSGGASRCAGACTQLWPPYTSSGSAVKGHGIDQGLVGTIARADGT